MMVIRMIVGNQGSRLIQDFSLLPVGVTYKPYLRPITAHDMSLVSRNCWTPRSLLWLDDCCLQQQQQAENFYNVVALLVNHP